MYKNGTYVLVGNRDWGEWLPNLVTNCIVGVTNSKYTHIKRYFNGYWYDSSFPKGAGRTTHAPSNTNGLNLFREPTFDFTEEQVSKAVIFAENAIEKKWKYNLIKLLVMGIILPIKRLFPKFLEKWQPFSKNGQYGTVCSVFDDEMLKSAGIDQFPNKSEEWTSPAMYEKLEGYRDL